MRISDWSSDVCSSDLVVGRLDQLLQALRRALQRLGVVDEGEVAVVERQEDVVAPGDGEGQVFRRYAVRGEEATIACLRHPVEVEAEHHVGLVAPALQAPLGRASCRVRECQYV